MILKIITQLHTMITGLQRSYYHAGCMIIELIQYHPNFVTQHVQLPHRRRSKQCQPLSKYHFLIFHLQIDVEGHCGNRKRSHQFLKPVSQVRDIFVVCRNISGQMNMMKFLINMRKGVFNWTNAIFEFDRMSEEEFGLISFIITHQSVVVPALSTGFEPGG
ncbi:uncharacterized protein MONOS_16967 [Monocercomonoides exilis]|uniref:uncharacterized protein n=1 Tax=Monocercomonoides exilis TaxID=2049356 RepID=UPI00355A6681|nr:hypothetical protein MONOS_16967 [Monocercomonoides exilis]